MGSLEGPHEGFFHVTPFGAWLVPRGTVKRGYLASKLSTEGIHSAHTQLMPGRLRRLTIYETAGRFYLVGCDASRMRFKVLKIDRIDSKTLLTGEPDCEYSKEEILELLATITEGSSVVYRTSSDSNTKMNRKGSPGLVERISNAFGLLGVIRFIEGYYLIVVTKASVIANVGYHSIYKIAEVAMISLAMEGRSTSNEEQRYVKLFQSVDLSTDFYFSYTYDLSRSLQENVLSANWDQDGERQLNPDHKFVWNTYLLEPLRNNMVSEQWFLEIVHGYVGQQLIDLPFTKLSLILIGRRSAEFAGTRFLKRGANQKGSVANDVETEQVLWDVSSSPNFKLGRFSSFVQRRGSVPLRWSQDPATRGVVGKPLILVDIHEPHAQTAAAHFRELRAKYGNPIVVMNLVKRREKRRHECLLHDQFLKAIDYLNQFLPPAEHIAYLSFDVARCNKASTVSSNVLTKMEEIGFKAVCAHGWFQSFPMPYTRTMDHRTAMPGFKAHFSSDGRFLIQRGISRTNCVDCLDRTNVAQFGIGRVALAFQLYSMGVVNYPSLSLQSDLCRAFEDLFDDHGDTMAWQYAGSQLVHSIKTYKKMAALQERSRDVIQTLSRYYSNTFGDYDKQAAINLFLGIYRPQVNRIALWDLTTDYYLHFPTQSQILSNYCAWMYEKEELEEIVGSYGNNGRTQQALSKPTAGKGSSTPRMTLRLSSSDDFRDFYRIFEMTTLENRVKAQVISDSRALSLHGINQEGSSSGQFMKLWKSDSKEKTKKIGRGESEDEDDDTLEEEHIGDEVVESEPAWLRLVNGSNTDEKQLRHLKSGASLANEALDKPVLATGLLFTKESYGLGRQSPPEETLAIYENYVNSGSYKFDEKDWIKYRPTLLTDLNIPMAANTRDRRPLFTTDDVFKTCPPEVSISSLNFYRSSFVSVDDYFSKMNVVLYSEYPSF